MSGRRIRMTIFSLIGIAVLILILHVLAARGFFTASDPAGEATTAPGVAGTDPGIRVYNKTCVVCHDTGAANAPKLGDRAAWEPRAAQGIDRLLQTTIAGKGAMPPRGACADCSDADLRAAIRYMLVQAGYQAAASSPAGNTP